MKPASWNRRTTLMRGARALSVEDHISAELVTSRIRATEIGGKKRGEKKEGRNEADLPFMYKFRTDLFAVRLTVAPHRNDHDLSWGQPQRPACGEARWRWSPELLAHQPPVGSPSSECFPPSPSASKVFRQDCDHSLQRSQHRPVDHHWPVQLTVAAEVRRKMGVIDESIIALKAESCRAS